MPVALVKVARRILLKPAQGLRDVRRHLFQLPPTLSTPEVMPLTLVLLKQKRISPASSFSTPQSFRHAGAGKRAKIFFREPHEAHRGSRAPGIGQWFVLKETFHANQFTRGDGERCLLAGPATLNARAADRIIGLSFM